MGRAESGEGVQHRVVGRLVPERLSAELLESAPLLVRGGCVGSVDDLVGHTEERVQHVGGVSDTLREDPRCKVEGLPRAALNRLALPDLGLFDHC